MNARNLLKKTIEMIEGAYAPSTIRAYKGNFEKFICFCETENKQALPAHSATVAKFIQELTKSGLKSASIRLAYASISTIHKLNELPDPTQSPIAKLELRRMHRAIGRESKQALGVSPSILKKMLDAAGNNLRDLRNKALILIAYETLCRRSELISLKTEDVEPDTTTGGALIKLRRSKTDQESIGSWLRINSEPYKALKLWIEMAGIFEGAIFRGVSLNGAVMPAGIKPAQINRIYKAMGKSANLSSGQLKKLSGHSMRVGAAQNLSLLGVNLPLLMAKGRWTKPETAIRYIKEIDGLIR